MRRTPDFIPIEKANITSAEKVGAADFPTVALSPSFPPSTFRIMIAVDVACKFSAVVIVSETAYVVHFNTATDLTANCLYTFDMLVHSGDTVQFEIDSTEDVVLFRVQEIPSSI